MTTPNAATESKPRTLVEVQGLGVTFNGVDVLRDVSLRVRRGETLVIIGESGCGKTVFLKSLIGLVRPTRGLVRFDGESLAGLSERRLAEIRTRYGFVFQQAALFDSSTVAENVAFPLVEHRRVAASRAYEVAAARLREVGLPESVLKKRPAELSGGMRKRVGLARALVMEPDLLLYDEPTTGLDPIMSDVVNELILRTRDAMWGEGSVDRAPVTSVVVTHDMQSARKLADRIVMLYPLSRLSAGESQIVYDGPPDKIDAATDERITQFVRGEARDRIQELSV